MWLLRMGQLQDDKKPSVWHRVLEVVILFIATVILALAILLSSMGNLPNADQFGFLNATERLFRNNRTQVNPPGWAFAVWGVIWIWQTLLILYAWSFIFRPSFPRTVSWISLFPYTVTNACGVIWVYLNNNGYRAISFLFIFIMWVFIAATITVQSIHLYKLTPRLLQERKYKIDLWMTRILVLNGLYTYGTWLTIATQLLQLTSVLQYDLGVHGTTIAAATLWLLTVVVLGYFALENTVLDRFNRFIFTVYPVIIWGLIGIISQHWSQEELNVSPVLSLLLLVLVIVLFVAKIIMVTLFAFYRPIPYKHSNNDPQQQQDEKIPL